MPVYIGIALKILSDFDLILTEHCFPKIIYIHIGRMFLQIPIYRIRKPPYFSVCSRFHPYRGYRCRLPNSFCFRSGYRSSSEAISSFTSWRRL